MTLFGSLSRLTLTTAFLLLVPLVAMQFTHEVTWTLSDFLVAGALIFGTGLLYQLVVRQTTGNLAYRLAAGVALAAGLLLIWMNLAVGLIGSENNPANLLYGGVFAVGLIGAIAARLRPRGMAKTLFAIALTQGLVPVLALLIWKPQADAASALVGILGVLAVNALFVLLWVGSAFLFRRASAASVPHS